MAERLKPFKQFSETIIRQKRARVAARPEWERLIIHQFAADLINITENRETTDIGAFMAEWPIARREFINGLPR
jgi:hypothetical protein